MMMLALLLAPTSTIPDSPHRLPTRAELTVTNASGNINEGIMVEATGGTLWRSDEASCECWGPEDYYTCDCYGPSFQCSCIDKPPCGPRGARPKLCQNDAGKCKPLCGSSWPSFASKQELHASPWGAYLTSLYGELPEKYPLALSAFWCFYKDKMSAAQVSAPPSVGQCPSSANAPDGQRYDENNAYSSKDLTWLWHSLGSSVFKGFGSHSVVEVSHRKDPFGDEHHGMWFVYAKGSGVFLDLGQTKIFQDHDDANAYFNCGKCGNEAMCQAAAAHGYDTVQFIAHSDSTNYPCAKSIGAQWMNVEIVAVKLVGTYPCGQAQGTAAALRAGWDGDKPCKCDPNNPNTNCVFS